MLGSYYYGFIVTQLPGGIISEKFGAKWMLGSMTMLASILTMLNPVATKLGGIGAIIGLRIVQGLAQVSHYVYC